jgi:hypothetical protein
MKSPSSVVKKKVEYINFCDSAQVKTEWFKYIKNTADLPNDQQSQIFFLVRKFNSSAIIAAFSMLIGKVGGAAPMAFFPLPTKSVVERLLFASNHVPCLLDRHNKHLL